MRFILMLTLLSFNFLYLKPTLSEDNTPVRITIYPTIIDKNVVGSSTTIINSKIIRENSHLPLGQLLGKSSGINFENLFVEDYVVVFPKGDKLEKKKKNKNIWNQR